MSKQKIIIAGTGGVGGYFGGRLANHFQDSQNVEVCFIARGEHLNKIREHGLKVIQGNDVFFARPSLATDSPSEIGRADFILVCTKSYGLEAMMHELQPCIGKNTVILPLLNGVNSRERIEKIFPGHLVAEGCVYIVSRLKEAGVIENSGNIQTLYFGADTPNDQLLRLENLFREAGIETTLSSDISAILWEKFIFLSPTATATSCFDRCIGELLSEPEGLGTLTGLIGEVTQLANARQIALPDDIIEKTLAKLRALPFGATSSMHSDIQAGKPENELETLTGYVLSEGKKHGIEMPVYQKTYEKLTAMASA